jgi:N-acetylmuramoyl-L-alanine amidase
MTSRFARTIAAAHLLLGLATILLNCINASSALATELAALSPASPVPSELPRTRFVIGLDRSVEYEVMALSNPNRVVVELPDVRMRLPSASEEKPAGLVKAFRGGLSGPGKSRVVIDVVAPVVVEKAEITREGNLPQLVIDLIPAVGKGAAEARKPLKSQPSGLGAIGLQPPLPRPATSPKERAAKAYKPVIVIDPGHGGDDSGAVKNGIVEKDAVLAFSKVLRDKLNASGQYRVIMTRDRDVFISLDERRAIAERNKASLFIAVHADYAGSHARGATIYSLTESTANALKRSARAEESLLTENELRPVQKTGGDLGTIKAMLTDLAKREVDVTKDRTNSFARSVIEFMAASTSMRENADREANFRVLKTAKVPSVLIELAYVTNAQDAQNLKSERWREEVASAIATAIDNYVTSPIARVPM